MSMNPFEKFTEKAQEVLTNSYQIMMEQRHSQLDVEHVLASMLQQPEGVTVQILERLDVDVNAVKEAVQDKLTNMPRLQNPPSQGMQVSIYLTMRLQQVFVSADAERTRLKDEYISTEHLLLAMVAEPAAAVSKLLKRFGLDKETIYQALLDVRGNQRVTDPQAEGKYQSLAKYSVD